jgi:RNA polymerase sigma-70 factor (ECF subfamily)
VAAGPAAELQTPGDAGERGWEADQAAGALQDLNADQRRVLELNILQGLTQREISEQTNLPLGTVKTHMRRGLIRLRERMATDAPTLQEGNR